MSCFSCCATVKVEEPRQFAPQSPRFTPDNILQKYRELFETGNFIMRRIESQDLLNLPNELDTFGPQNLELQRLRYYVFIEKKLDVKRNRAICRIYKSDQPVFTSPPDTYEKIADMVKVGYLNDQQRVDESKRTDADRLKDSAMYVIEWVV